MRCPEHGVPQTFEDTELPGTTPKYALLLGRRNRDADAPTVVAPYYDMSQLENAQAKAKSLGYDLQQVVPIYSPADLVRVEAGRPGAVLRRQHEPGCVFSAYEHPGNCNIDEDMQYEQGAP
jgi:hypothetical protein